MTRTAALDIAARAPGATPANPGVPSGVLQVAVSPRAHQEIVARAKPAAARTPAQIAFQFFVAKGLSKVQSSGIVGNLMQESGPDLNPRIAQYQGGPGRGIAQWGVQGRWDTSSRDNVLWYARTHHVSEYALTTQLGFIWYELTTVPAYGMQSLRAAKTVSQATNVFMARFEICGACDASQRLAYAERTLRSYGGTAVASR